MLEDLLSLPMAGMTNSLSLAHPPDPDSAPQNEGVLLAATVSRAAFAFSLMLLLRITCAIAWCRHLQDLHAL